MGRFNSSHIDTWRREGVVRLESFFTADEVAAVAADFETVFGRSAGADEGMNRKKGGEIGKFNPKQFTSIKPVPLECSPALNLIGVHPEMIRFAKEALGTDHVHLYQCQTWAKFTGDADYDQPFHCDFSNHTLTAPSEDPTQNCITIICYFSEVTEQHGPMHYVPRTASAEVAGPEASLNFDTEAQRTLQEGLAARARSSAAPAGSIFPYGIDVYHRGTNLTAPHGHRYAVMACYKDAANDSIGFHAWPFHHLQPWRNIFEHATPEQLACFGVKPPGHPFWTQTTLARAQARYPGWDMTPYRAALGTDRRMPPSMPRNIANATTGAPTR